MGTLVRREDWAAGWSLWTTSRELQPMLWTCLSKTWELQGAHPTVPTGPSHSVPHSAPSLALKGLPAAPETLPRATVHSLIPRPVLTAAAHEHPGQDRSLGAYPAAQETQGQERSPGACTFKAMNYTSHFLSSLFFMPVSPPGYLLTITTSLAAGVCRGVCVPVCVCVRTGGSVRPSPCARGDWRHAFPPSPKFTLNHKLIS